MQTSKDRVSVLWSRYFRQWRVTLMTDERGGHSRAPKDVGHKAWTADVSSNASTQILIQVWYKSRIWSHSVSDGEEAS